MGTRGKRPFDPLLFFERATDLPVREFSAKQTIFTQGDESDSIIYLKQGQIKLSLHSAQGKEAVVAILGDGSFFGEGCLVGQVNRMVTATPLTPCVVVEIERKIMVDLLYDHPEFSALFIEYLLARNVRVEEDLVDQLFNFSEKRLARVLLIQAKSGKGAHQGKALVDLDHETLAAMVGTTRSRVGFFLSKFHRLGFIEYDEGLLVHSSLVSVLLADSSAGPGPE